MSCWQNNTHASDIRWLTFADVIITLVAYLVTYFDIISYLEKVVFYIRVSVYKDTNGVCWEIYATEDNGKSHEKE